MDIKRILLISTSAAVLIAPRIAAAAPPWPDRAASSAWPDQRAEDLYDQARELIEDGRYDRALDRLNRLIDMNTGRTDAALYWKAYSLGKLGQRDDALTAIADMARRFKDSKWIKDAKVLEVEIRQASGQPVSPDAQSDDDIKLMALQGLMRSDEDRAVTIIEQMLKGNNSLKVKDRALFVLSQSRSPRAQQIIGDAAKGNGHPDLQLKAIHYLGIMSRSDSNRQLLADVYRATPDPAVKRAILRSFMLAHDSEHLVAVAKTEQAPELRADAVRQLGLMRAGAELADLYANEQSPEVKKQILQAMFLAGMGDKLIQLSKNEKDQDVRRSAIRNLGLLRSAEASEALVSVYGSDANVDVRKSVVNALFLQNNAKALVDLARAEKNVEMKKDIVSKLSVMKSKEAADYLMELLK
jgi:tetratricopeptide (TPR) repeat protein